MKMTTILNDRYQQDEVLSAVLAAGSVLLFGHVSPDGDTLGSVLALKLRLERMGKKVQAMVDGFVPSYLTFLPGHESVLAADAAPAAFDLAIAVDVASADRMGKCEALFAAAEKTAVIDHHGTNPGYAQINMIDEYAPATAILVYRLFCQMDMPMTKDEAICLYTALSTDTGNFIYDSTNAESFAMMSGLMEAGLPLADYSRRLFRQKEEPHVRLLAEVLPGLRVIADGKIAGLRLNQQQLHKANANGGHCEGIVDYAIDLRGVGMAYFAREMADGRIKVSMRALEPYAVDQIAARFGGGGHKLAAGVTLEMPMDEAVQTIENALCEAL
ncbi:MAG: bifunctional oligoribonuclease/PAP phosphatase NrnA [Clostridia bacterium]|nr:bifunctional oligoribonuclease/PAP phosphatase NrnA [Clostridia bacterium]